MDVDQFPGLEARIAMLTGDDMADTSAEDAPREENFKKSRCASVPEPPPGSTYERVRVPDKTRWEPVLTMEQLAEICSVRNVNRSTVSGPGRPMIGIRAPATSFEILVFRNSLGRLSRPRRLR